MDRDLVGQLDEFGIETGGVLGQTRTLDLIGDRRRRKLYQRNALKQRREGLQAGVE